MRTLNLDLDLETGVVLALGKDGRRYTLEEIDAADRAATRGDAAAAATLLAVDHGLDAHGDRLTREEMQAAFDRIIDDCPDCQAARARGEQPIGWSAEAGSGDVPRGTNSHARRRARERRRRGLAT